MGGINMKIADANPLQLTRTSEQHFGNSKVQSLTSRIDLSGTGNAAEIGKTSTEGNSFQSYLLEAVNTVNNNQLNVSNIQEKLITNPDEVDVHDVTIAMSKARMSLNLAQTVIDRLVTDWNEITTTR